MEPITREEMYLAAAAGEYSGELPEPKTRLEYYLKKIKEAVENGSSVAPEEINAAIEDYLNMHDAASQYRHTFVGGDAESVYRSDLYIFYKIK